MTYRLPPLSSLRVFEAAARLLSFKLAAQELHVTPAAVSQQIKSLETFLGIPLFHRESRGLTLTARGRALYPGIRDGFGQFAGAIERVLRSDQRELNVTAPPSFATRWLVPRLSGFSRDYPDIALRVRSDPANIDPEAQYSAEVKRSVDARDEGPTIAIRFGRGDYAGRVSKILVPDYVLVCSPKLMRGETGASRTLDLHQQVLLHDESITAEKDRPNWEAWLKLAGYSDIDFSRGPRFSNSIMTLEAALDGQGIALLLEPLVTTELEAGRLVAPFPVRLPSRYAYYLTIPEALLEHAAVITFATWLNHHDKK